jgi:hypothetical protein
MALVVLDPRPIVSGHISDLSGDPVKRRRYMLKKPLVLLLASVLTLTFPLATAVFAQDAPTKEKVAKEVAGRAISYEAVKISLA